MEQATALLKEGKVQEAHDLLADKQANPDPAPPPPPPQPAAIIARPVPGWVTSVGAGAQLVTGIFGELLPLLEGIVTHLGSHPAHVAALDSLKALHAGVAKHGE